MSAAEEVMDTAAGADYRPVRNINSGGQDATGHVFVKHHDAITGSATDVGLMGATPSLLDSLGVGCGIFEAMRGFGMLALTPAARIATAAASILDRPKRKYPDPEACIV